MDFIRRVLKSVLVSNKRSISMRENRCDLNQTKSLKKFSWREIFVSYTSKLLKFLSESVKTYFVRNTEKSSDALCATHAKHH